MGYRDTAVGSDDVNCTLEDEKHFGAYGALVDDVVTRLVHLELQFGHYARHELGICVFEEGNDVDQVSAVVVQDFLNRTKIYLLLHTTWGTGTVSRGIISKPIRSMEMI